MIPWAIILLTTGATLSAWTGQWFILGCAVGTVATNVIMIRLSRRDRERRKAASSWPEPGTVRRTAPALYEVWDGKEWVKV